MQQQLSWASGMKKSHAKSYSNCLVYQISSLKRPDSAWLLSAIFSVALGGSKTCSIGVWEKFFVCVFAFGVGYQKVLQCLAQTRWYCQSTSNLQKVISKDKIIDEKQRTRNVLRWEVWPNWGAKLKSKTRDWTENSTRHRGRCFEGVNQCVHILYIYSVRDIGIMSCNQRWCK